jgi:hypothetical protein
MDGEHIDSYLDVDGSCGVQYVFVTWEVLMVMIHKVQGNRYDRGIRGRE